MALQLKGTGYKDATYWRTRLGWLMRLGLASAHLQLWRGDSPWHRLRWRSGLGCVALFGSIRNATHEMVEDSLWTKNYGALTDVQRRGDWSAWRETWTSSGGWMCLLTLWETNRPRQHLMMERWRKEWQTAGMPRWLEEDYGGS